jgi:hypothetical protein
VDSTGGILLDDSGASQGYVVEDIRADMNRWVGIRLRGSGNIVRNSQVVATGRSTLFGANADAYGIYVGGAGPRVRNNDAINTVKLGTGTAYGIAFSSVTGCQRSSLAASWAAL